MQVGVDVAPPGAGEGEAVVLRASASAVTFQGFLAAYAPQHFRRGAAPGAGVDEDGAGGGDAAEGGPGGEGAADEELSATLMRLAVRQGPPVLWRVFSCAARPKSMWHQPPKRFCVGKLANRAQVLGHVGSSKIPLPKRLDWRARRATGCGCWVRKRCSTSHGRQGALQRRAW